MTKWDHITGRSQEELNEAAHQRLSNTDAADQYRTLTGKEIPSSMRSGELGKD